LRFDALMLAETGNEQIGGLQHENEGRETENDDESIEVFGNSVTPCGKRIEFASI
jgi:hypothetical protein